MQERHGNDILQCIGEGLKCSELLHLPALGWADPRLVCSLELHKIRRCCWQTAFLLLVGQQSFAWMEGMPAVLGSVSQQRHFMGTLLGGPPAGQLLERDSCSTELRQDLPVLSQLAFRTQLALPLLHTQAHCTTPGPRARSSWKSLKSGKKKGVGRVWDVMWHDSTGMDGHRSTPSPFPGSKSLSSWKGWSECWCQFHGSQLGVSPFLEGLATSLLPLWLGRKHSQGWLSNQGISLGSWGKHLGDSCKI